MVDMVARYRELRNEAEAAGQDLLNQYEDDPDSGRQSARATTKYGLQKIEELEALAGKPVSEPPPHRQQHACMAMGTLGVRE